MATEKVTTTDAWNDFGVKLEQMMGAITVLRVAYQSGNLPELAATTFLNNLEDQCAAIQNDFVELGNA
jgi:hypothetical protein